MNANNSFPSWLIYLFSFIGVIYLLNPTADIIELIPDNIPIIGHLDEAAAAFLVWQGINKYIKSRKSR
jgi:uncharacterized membrane protein YkvA (DUF1232 family)